MGTCLTFNSISKSQLDQTLHGFTQFSDILDFFKLYFQWQRDIFPLGTKGYQVLVVSIYILTAGKDSCMGLGNVCGGHRTIFGVILVTVTLIFRQGLSLIWNLPISQADCPGSPQVSACLCLPALTLHEHAAMPGFFHKGSSLGSDACLATSLLTELSP